MSQSKSAESSGDPQELIPSSDEAKPLRSAPEPAQASLSFGPAETPFDRAGFQRALAALATQGVYVGTSSWKYAGWRGQIYDAARYTHRGKFAESRFERDCLAEYAETFKTVCVDAAYYQFPDPRQLARLVSQVPEDFLFTFKVTEEITLKRFTNLPRFGRRAGLANENFLNAELFARAFLGPCEPYRRRVGLLIFEFSKFYPTDYAQGRDFVADLDTFLGRLPVGWPYGVEIRNQGFLRPEYFATLHRHGATHVFNSWADMPPVVEQMTLAGSRTNLGRLAARLLLTPGRKYQEAVERFRPYARLQEPDPQVRAAGAALIREGLATKGRKTFIYVNNRLEGNAPGTIAALLQQSRECGTMGETASPL